MSSRWRGPTICSPIGRPSADNPAGICGPIGPTEQLPLVARIVNCLGMKLGDAHFWGMDEWVIGGKEAPQSHPLSFARADRELCFDRLPRAVGSG